jgi:hypothetical protein
MKKIALLFITLSFLASSAYATTFSVLWKTLDPLSKRLIILGYKEGLKDGLAIAKKADATEPTEIAKIDTHQHKVTDGTYKNIYTMPSEVIQSEMDKFYANDFNQDVPLDYAILYITQKENGVSEIELRKDLVTFEKTAFETAAKLK